MSSTRYVEMSEKLYDEISARVRKSYPNSCIVWIEENINPALRANYERLRDEISARVPDSKEVQFFHGTKEENINSILAGGFDATLNKTSAYGKGTYFARDAMYSYSYMHPGKEQISYMFLCDVVLGKPTLGQANTQIPKGYDSFVDRLQDPSIVVTPYDAGAFPRYIIAFHKSAK
jgi:hypothetical protein